VGREYPPASTFKLITAVAGLESSAVSPEHEETCTGHRMVGGSQLLDMGVHGTLDFVEALQHSCNVYFWAVGERVGIARLAAVARDFGFGERTGVGFGGDPAGQVPDASRYGDSEPHRVLRLQAAIGLGDVRATVLQVAMAYAALANGGRLYRPQIVRRIETRRGEPIEEPEPILRRHVAASPATLEVIRRGLYRAVNRRGGTAFAAKKGVVKMVGKTGTAPLPANPEESHAWFAGWAPADHPRMAIAVLVENGGIGGAVAAPVARDIIDAYYLHAAREKRAARRAQAAAKAKAKKAKDRKRRKKTRAARRGSEASGRRRR
ncbi:MAG TPA: penicillin-binding transpeptidase domain-containing protein, partial [Kofleriaceae bacterium]|nr:penicillin-binding transpeptidase domain-containing protein [Kofleriaceae bacterium]